MLTKIKAVRVQEIIMSGSTSVIGTIKYSGLLAGKPRNTKRLPSAKPLFYNFSQYPAVNEIVYVLAAPHKYFNKNGQIGHYYLPPINVNGAPNHNAQPNEITEEEFKLKTETSVDNFIEVNNIRPLLPNKGDIMIEGRYGNSIRFGSITSGSNQPNHWSNEGSKGDPITIIRNGQNTNDPDHHSSKHILEDINNDDSSIYLCARQQITNFQKAGITPKDDEYPLASYKHML